MGLRSLPHGTGVIYVIVFYDVKVQSFIKKFWPYNLFDLELVLKVKTYI